MGTEAWYRIEQNREPDTATIYLHNEIGGMGITSGQFVEELGAVTAKTLKLHINSPGGSVDDGIAIYNALKSHPATIEAHVDAAAHSIASVIVQAADRRVMAPHSRMMIHSAMAGGVGIAIGYAEDFDAFAAEAQKVAERLRETSAEIATIYSERSKKDPDYWLAKMAAETRFTDKQAVEEGLADEVGRDFDARAFKIAAHFDWSKYHEANQIKAEFEEVAPDEPLTESNRESVRGAITALEAVLAQLKSIEGPGAPEQEPPRDPRDAARRELEARLAAVEV